MGELIKKVGDTDNLSAALNMISIEDTPMSTNEQIEFYIQNKMPFMLHGMSGVGKSRRIKDIDPDFVSIYLRNGMLPEEVIGKTIYPNNDTTKVGKWVPPSWYGELCDKCEKDKDKVHVLFIDELTNARETVQSLAYHLVLEHSIAPNMGKLPDNCVVVCAGNSRDESAAANIIPEPLFRRFVAHIYLEPKIQDWVEWGQKIDNETGHDRIHPVVRAFVSANEKLFCSNYDPEDPPKYALDPRAWEQVSDVIYASKGRIATEIIENKIGKNNATKFINFAKQYVSISVQDIISGNYSRSKLPSKADEIYAFVLTLTNATNEQVGTVRDFIQNEFGNEYLKKYDLAWIGTDLERALVIDTINKKKIAKSIASKIGKEQGQGYDKFANIDDGSVKIKSDKLKNMFTTTIDECLDKNSPKPHEVIINSKEQYDALAKVLDSRGAIWRSGTKYSDYNIEAWTAPYSKHYIDVRDGTIGPAGFSDEAVDISEVDMIDDLTDAEMKTVYGDKKYQDIKNAFAESRNSASRSNQTAQNTQPQNQVSNNNNTDALSDKLKNVFTATIDECLDENSSKPYNIIFHNYAQYYTLAKVLDSRGATWCDKEKYTDSTPQYSACYVDVREGMYYEYFKNAKQPLSNAIDISEVDMTNDLTLDEIKTVYGDKIYKDIEEVVTNKLRNQMISTTIDDCLDNNSPGPYKIIVDNYAQYYALAKVLDRRGVKWSNGDKFSSWDPYTKNESELFGSSYINVRRGVCGSDLDNDNDNIIDISEVDMINDLTLGEIRTVYGDTIYQDIKDVFTESENSANVSAQTVQNNAQSKPTQNTQSQNQVSNNNTKILSKKTLSNKVKNIVVTTIDKCLDKNSSSRHVIVVNKRQYDVLAKVLDSRGVKWSDGRKYSAWNPYTDGGCKSSNTCYINVRRGLFGNDITFNIGDVIGITQVDLESDLTLSEIRTVYGDNIYQEIINDIEESSKSM